MTETVSTTTSFEIENPKEGVYNVKQIENEKLPDLNSGSRIPFNFDVQVFSVSGYLDPEDKEFAVWPSVVGIQIGDGYKVGFSSGVQINIVLLAYNGSVRFYVEGRALKMQLHLKPLLPWGDDVNFNGNVITF